MVMDNILEMKNITKLYPGVIALNNVDFVLKKGEVHALLGENGAGKSTLIKILAGSVERDSGTIWLDGKTCERYTPHEAIGMGISVIYQEFNLVSNMTIEENLFFGREIKKGIFIDKKAMQDKTRALFRELGIEIDPMQKTASLSVAYQQLTEIAKALISKAKIIVMDEPSATLTNKELQILFQLIRRLKAEGVSIIYISHRLEEVFEIADTMTVFRDGSMIATKPISQTNPRELIHMMVGRDLSDSYPDTSNISDEIVLEARDLFNEKVKHASFYLKKGEILGLSGLVGAGRTELARILFGADPYLGDIYVKGKKAKIRNPRDAVRLGISLLPEDRKTQGLILKMGIDVNITLTTLHSISKRGWIYSEKETELIHKYVETLKIKTPSMKQTVNHLSGGNQQKVILAKWLACETDIIIFDEPTRGIDVGAKTEVYELMHDLVMRGKSIIMISSELPELIGMSNRVIVMHEGVIVGELNKGELEQERLLEIASGNKGEIA